MIGMETSVKIRIFRRLAIYRATLSGKSQYYNDIVSQTLR